MKKQSLGASEVEILSRVFKAEEGTLSAEAARAILGLHLDQRDRDRAHELVVKNQEEILTEEELTELDNYRRVGHLLDLLASKARLSLKQLGLGG